MKNYAIIQFNEIGRKEKVTIQKVDPVRDSKINKMKSLKALVRTGNQFIQITVETGSPLSFLNWVTKKETIDIFRKPRFFPAEKLNPST